MQQELNYLFKQDRLQRIPDYSNPTRVELRFIHRSLRNQSRALNILEYNSLPE
jgi:hypothetical protein